MVDKVVMLPFKADAICPKCGHDEVRSIYVARDSSSWRVVHAECGGSNREHIDRRCERCGYRWAENPIASSGAAEGTT